MRLPIRRAAAAYALTLAAAYALVGGTSSCSKSPVTFGVADNCSINSDCDSPLICAFGKCHVACTEQRDCSASERCVASTLGGVCQLVAESSCNATTLCQADQVCGADGQCRSACQASTGCATGDYCVATNGTGVCYSPANMSDLPTLVAAGVVASDGAALSDSGTVTVMPDATTTNPDGSPSTGYADAGEAGAESGPPPNHCVSPQTQFGAVAQGDTNPNFTSGVGVRGPDAMYVFSGYNTGGDAGEGGAGTNAVYVQAFDPNTAQKLGSAQQLFVPTLPGPVFVWAAGVAPTGEIAVLYTSSYSSGTGSGLWAAFLESQPDGGTAGLGVAQTASLEAEEVGGQPTITWSNLNQAFAMSWLYLNTNNDYYLARVSKFLPNGRAAGGDTATVQTNRSDDLVDPGVHYQASVAEGAGVLGVGFMSYAGDVPYVSVLSALGNAVGSPVALTTGTSPSWITVGGTDAGLLAVYGYNGVQATLVPVDADGGVPAAFPEDGGDAGSLQAFRFSGTEAAIYGRALNDDVGGTNGIGLALLYNDGLSFAYVNADGLTYVGPDATLPHAYGSGDFANISNYAGSFGLSLYESAAHTTVVVSSGCN